MYDNWDDLENSIKDCNKCKLCNGRKNIVFGVGNRAADLMLIGEGTGADEDVQGIPFVGKAGQLMNRAFEGLGIKREEIYIANIVKCRPPNNRDPEVDEAAVCLNYLRNQVILVKPKVVVLLGRIALKNILGDDYGITASRGKIIENDESLPICQKKDIKLGAATIRSAITGEVKEYDIKIISVDYFARNENKRIMIEVVDEELLGLTGGIVQGMSGSPIIQDGKLVGAVTHVLVNDPTRGYGIFIKNMLDAVG